MYNNADDIKNLSDKELEEFLKRYWKTQSFDFYGKFIPENRVASFFCGVISHVKVPGTSQLMSYPFIRRAVTFKIPARYRIKNKGYYKFSCIIAPIHTRIYDKNYSEINLEFESLTPISEMQYNNRIAQEDKKVNSPMTEYEKKLFKELHDRKESDVQTFMDEDYEGFWDSVISKYPESAHFVYELLQNADDAKATSATFVLRKDGLIFVHNGTRHFNITDRNDKTVKLGDINAIVNIGHNNKNGINTIGKFGVGFKSVFQYTDTPEIYDDTFKFKIEKYIVPTLIDHDFKGREPGQTLFYIPFKDKEKDYGFIKNRLGSLKSPILFLRNLRSVKWKDDSETYFHEYDKTVEHIMFDEKSKIECSLVTEKSDNKENHINMFSRKVNLGGNIYDIFLGYFLENRSLDTKTKRKVFCFFLTSVSFGMPFISHAPFLTTDNRDGLLPDSDENKFFVDELAKLAADSLVCLKKIGEKNGNPLLTSNLFDIVPVEYANRQYVEGQTLRGESIDISIFYNLLTQKIKGENLIYTNSGDYLSIYDVYRTDLRIRSLVSREQLNSLLNSKANKTDIDDSLNKLGLNTKPKDFVLGSFDFNVRNYMTNVLRIPEFTDEMFAKGITSDFMKDQSEEWVTKLYNYISRSNTIGIYKHSSLVKTQNGEWKSPFNENDEELVYLPVFKTNEYSEASYDFVDMNSYTENHDFFVNVLKLSQPNIVDFIKTALVPHYANPNEVKEDISIPDFDTLMHIFFAFQDDLEARKERNPYTWEFDKNSEKKEFNNLGIQDLIDIISKEILFKAIDGSYCHINNLYEGNDELRIYFNDCDSMKEFDLNFYTQEASDWKKTQIHTFIHAIGIDSKHPCIITSEYQEDTKVFRDFKIECFYKCTESAYNSKFMWNSIIKDSQNFHVLQPYSYIYNRSVRKERGFTDIYTQLSKTNWIFNANGERCYPTDITLEEFHNLGYKPCNTIETELDFGRKAKEEFAKQEKLAEEKQKEDNLAIIDLYKGNLEEAQKAKELYESINNSGVSMDTVNTILEYLKQKGNENIEDQDADDSFENGLDDYELEDTIERGKRANVIKTEHFIGLKLFEGYLKKKELKYEVLDQNENGYDLKVEPHELVGISVIKDKEINTDKHSPINVTREQHGLMTRHGINQFTIIRIALKDLGLNFDKEIRDLWGADADIGNDDFFKRRCEKFAENYWKGKSPKDFEQMTAKYQVKVTREI